MGNHDPPTDTTVRQWAYRRGERTTQRACADLGHLRRLIKPEEFVHTRLPSPRRVHCYGSETCRRRWLHPQCKSLHSRTFRAVRFGERTKAAVYTATPVALSGAATMTTILRIDGIVAEFSALRMLAGR